MQKPGPMLATHLQGEPRKGSVFEPKVDGHRVVVHKVGSTVEVYTRTGHDQSGKLPHLESAFLAVPFDFTLDGEAVSIRKVVKVRGKQVPISTLSTVQSVMGSGAGRRVRGRATMAFVAFDCLSAQGKDLTGLPDVLRRGALELVVEILRTFSPQVVLMPRWDSKQDVHKLFSAVVDAGGEGLMVKNPLATYRPGKRPQNTWHKLKALEEES